MATKHRLGEDEIEKRDSTRWRGGEDYKYIKHITKKKRYVHSILLYLKNNYLWLCTRASSRAGLLNHRAAAQ
jgi:hypothetical protein